MNNVTSCKHLPYGAMAIIAMKGCEEFADKVDYYLRQWREAEEEATYVIHPQCPRFGTGEAKAVLNHTARSSIPHVVLTLL